MKILYGVTGEGMGHATRSRVTIAHLLRKGHQVKVVVYGRAYGYLKRLFPDVAEIQGLTIDYRQGAMDLLGTIAKNAVVLPQLLAANASVTMEVQRYAPQAVITDFEPFAYLFSQTHSLPVMSIDNPQMIHRCMHDEDIIAGNDGTSPGEDFRTADAFVALTQPRCTFYVITSFFYPQVKEPYQKNTLLVSPILRDDVLKAVPSDAGHVLVYQTSSTNEELMQVLQQFPQQKFIVYGLGQDAILGNCILKAFTESGFVKDLASAKAVIANGGMSLMGESLSLGKPIYSVPVRNHFEQIMNARYLQKMGYGLTSERFDPRVLDVFLRYLPQLKGAIHSVTQHDRNETLFRAVDSFVGNG